MNIISGISRSGTSLMMDCMLKTFGEERIYGEKFPQEKQMEYLEKQHPEEEDHRFQCRQYLNRDSIARTKEDFKKSCDMNPNGFWESPYAVQGVFYRFQDRLKLEQWEYEDKPTICKIVGRGLWQSDPQYIDKIVYMIRHPRDIAKSQERLKRGLPEFIDNEGNNHKLEDEITIHTPKMYIQVTQAVCAWLVEYPFIPMLHVYYDELVERPENVFKEIQEFLEEGDFKKAIKSINPRLRRSKAEDIKNTLWGVAEAIYLMFLEEDYQGVLDYLEDTPLDVDEGEARFPCTRTGQSVNSNECKSCKSPTSITSELVKRAEDSNINWRAEPCMYDCGFGPGPYITITESIKNNSWSR